ncbi:transposase [Streptosporangium subroseum]|uniref:RNA-guided endonuclease InsQ/TnpB family protein n=1 Tax=Streptosporangium subroseum TaxID=106412 RepID=UPI003412FCA4
MKLVVQVKLLPTPEQAAALETTLRAVNQAANRVSALAYETGVCARMPLQRRVYGELKAAGLSAQPALHVIRKVADAYTTLHTLIRGGRLGKPASKRRCKAESKPIAFRAGAAQPFDDRCLSWQHNARTVSIWTTCGRMKGIAFTGSADQLKTLAQFRQGESDLIQRDTGWFLVATCEVPAALLNTEPAGWLGVDRGIVNLATTSDGTDHCGKELTAYRRKAARLRAELQARGTKSARRKLKRRAKREARHASNTNHVIAKKIVADAQRTGRGIALEDLAGIRDRVRLHAHQRATLCTWSFHQLGAYIGYKAHRAGAPCLEVDPAYTSQTCPNPWCGHVSRANRPDRDTFYCTSCGLAGPADYIAAVNVARRGAMAWVFVNMPNEPDPERVRLSASSSCQPDRTKRRKPRASALGR